MVPSARARREFLAALAGASSATLTALAIPRVVTLRSLPDQLFAPPPGLPREAHPLELRHAALSAIAHAPVGSLLGANGGHDAAAARALVLHQLQPALDEMAAGDVSPTDIAQWYEGRGLFDEAALWSGLGRWRTAVEDGLRRRGILGPLARRRCLIENGARRADRVVLAAIDDVPAIAREALEKFESLGGAVDILVLADEVHGERVNGWGVPLAGAFLDASQCEVERCDSPADQSARVAGIWAHEKGAAALVVVDGPMEESLVREFSSLGRPVRTSRQEMLSATAAGRVLVTLMAWVARRTEDSLVALLADPVWDPSALESCHKRLEESLLSDGGALWSRLLRDGAIPERLVAMEGCLRESWNAAVLLSTLREVVPPVRSGINEVCDAIEQVDRLAPDLAAGDALALLEHALRTTESTVGHAPEGIPLFGWLEATAIPAESMIVCGVHGASLPAPPSNRGLLSPAIRERFQLASREQRLARDSFRLAGLVRRFGSRLHVLSPRTSTEGDPLPLPRIVLGARSDERVATVALAEQVDRLAQQSASPRWLVKRSAAAGGSARTRGFAKIPTPARVLATGTEGDPLHALSVTDFQSYLSDPWRFWVERVLGLKAPEWGVRELVESRIGKVLHGAWSALAAPALAHEGSESVLADAAHQALDRAMAAELDSTTAEWPAAVQVQARRLHERVKWLARLEASQRAAGWFAAEAEWSIVGPSSWCEAAPILELGPGEPPMPLKGRVDRIEVNAASGAWRVLDLKSRGMAVTPAESHFKGKTERKWLDLQLPLYRFLLSRDGVQPQVGYMNLPADGRGAHVAMADRADGWDESVFDAAVEEARRVVRALRTQAIVEPTAAVKKQSEWARLARATIVDEGAGGEEDGDE